MTLEQSLLAALAAPDFCGTIGPRPLCGNLRDLQTINKYPMYFR
jgi:hypothetical protein